ncbi:ROK family protein [Candidatus Berkelbacteria bacterium]|nr:ROK family protein [Candidatus Berkelbacteria bacterium]
MIAVFDIGGTHLRVAVSTDGSRLGEPVILDTPAAFEEGITLLTQTIRELAPNNLTTIVGGIAGPLDKQHGMVRNAPNLPGWNNQPLRERLAKEFNVPVLLENDTALVGLGEAVAGAGRGHAIVAYLTVSTGVNGVRIVDGSIDRNTRGFEIGHQIVSSEHINCPTCDVPGHLEGLIGGRTLEERFGMPPSRLKNENLEAWEDVLRYAAIGVHNLLLYWSPDIVVIGGGLARDIVSSHLEQRVQSLITIWPDIPPIVLGELQDIGGLKGALHLARSQSL